MTKQYTIIVRETGWEEGQGQNGALYAMQREIPLTELKYLLGEVRATRPDGSDRDIIIP